jgi:hypothetical protein
VTLHDGQHQQRQPGEKRDDEDASLEQFQRVAGQMRAPKKLIQRPAQD